MKLSSETRPTKVTPPIYAVLEYDDFTRLLMTAEHGQTTVVERANRATLLQYSNFLKLAAHGLATDRGKGQVHCYELTKFGRRALAQLAALREEVGSVHMLILSNMDPFGEVVEFLEHYRALEARGLCDWVARTSQMMINGVGKQLVEFAMAERDAERKRIARAPLPTAAQIGAIGLQALHRMAEGDGLALFHPDREPELVQAGDELDRLRLCDCAGCEGPFLEFEISDSGCQVLEASKNFSPLARLRALD